MSCNDDIMRRVIMAAQHHMSADDLDRFARSLTIILHDYDICKSETALAVADGADQRELKMFAVAKKMAGCSELSIKGYGEEINRFLLFSGKSLKDITTEDIRYYLAREQMDKGLKKATLNHKLSILSSLFEWLTDEEYISKNPAKRVAKAKAEKAGIKPFSATQLEQLRCACDNMRDRAIVEVLYSTGMRVSELCSLNITDINQMTREASVIGKGNKRRTVYFSESAILHLNSYLNSRTDESNALLVTLRNPHNRLTRRSVETVIASIGKTAGIEGAHPHRFRHTTATAALHRGMRLEQVQKLLGHSSPSTTMIYAEVNDDQLRMSCDQCLAG